MCLSLLSAMRFVEEQGFNNFSNVIFESDCMGVVDKIKQNVVDVSELHTKFNEYRNLMSHNQTFYPEVLLGGKSMILSNLMSQLNLLSRGFVRSQFNDIVHPLCRVVSSFPCLFIFYYVPSCIQLIIIEMSRFFKYIFFKSLIFIYTLRVK